MQARDPAAKLEELLARPFVKVCGLTREEDVAVAAEAGADLAGFVLAPESPRAAEGVLPVPDELLAVAVWVGEPGVTEAALDQVHERIEGAVRGRDGVLLRESTEVARVLDLPWQEDDPGHWDRAAAEPGRIVLAGRACSGQRRGGGGTCAPMGRRRELEARVRSGDQGRGQGAGLRRGSTCLRPCMARTAAATCPRR